jgi:hypothetical protein
MLTTMEAALLRGHGYEFPTFEPLSTREFRAIAVKGRHRAEAIGPTRDAAARNLVRLITRR